MEDKKPVIISEMFKNLYGSEGRKELEFMAANMKAEFEKLNGVECFVTSRVKAPVSILQKYDTEEKYSENWNSMKDLLGFMLVVDNNQDVDDVLYYVEEQYESLKNPNSKLLYKDFRKKSLRKKEDGSSYTDEYIDMPSDKGYQTSNGYKNCRINLMINDYPVEIQVKTKEQYIAHVATHDPVYKAKGNIEKSKCEMVSDALFPYFEAYAHLILKEDEMSKRQIDQCKKDILEIYNRNFEIYSKYPKIFREASSVFAAYIFILKNREDLQADTFLNDQIPNNQLLESEILRIFEFKKKELLKNDKMLQESDAFSRTINYIINMSYEEFKALRKQIAGDFRKDICVITGVFDMINEKDIKLIQRCAESFRQVVVAPYNDSLTELYLGQPPMYTLAERKEAVGMIRGVTSVSEVDISGIVKYEGNIKPFILDKPKPKKYKVGYLPGVFDMFHPGHIEYIKQVIDLCDEVFVGIKTDDYVRIFKNKVPIMGERERQCIAASLFGVNCVYLTPYDILPPAGLLERMNKMANSGKACAVFLGSDWKLKPEKKGPSSKEEYRILSELYKNITLDSIDRGDSGRSSTGYRERAKKSCEFVNPYELTTTGVES